jgi:hypothetical protein
VRIAAVLAVPTLLCVVAAGHDARAAGEPAPPGRFTCDGTAATSFAAAALDGPRGAERARTGAAAALRRELRDPGEPVPRHGWRLLRDGRTTKVFGHGRPPTLATVTLERERGRWTWAHASLDCRPEALRDGLTASTWRLDPAAQRPDAQSRDVRVLVTESTCSGGAPADGRVEAPRIRVEAGRVVVTFFVTPPDSGDGLLTCVGNPATRVTLRLPEALGDRELVDASTLPLRVRAGRPGALSSADLTGARATAVAYATAYERHDGAAACAQLSLRIRTVLGGAAGPSGCPDEVTAYSRRATPRGPRVDVRPDPEDRSRPYAVITWRAGTTGGAGMNMVREDGRWVLDDDLRCVTPSCDP